MYRRMVFVGLGGSGGKTLRFLKRDLRHWLTEHGWPEGREIPAGFQFLHIDTPTVQDGRSMGGAEMLPDKEYVGLVGSNVTYTQVANQLDNVGGIKEEFAGWRVNPAMVAVPITDGAGAYRAIGRTIALAYMEQINSSLSELVRRSTSAESISELDELWAMTHGGVSAVGQASDPVVVVISSLAGGTGAGLLLDVFDVIRSLQPSWGDKSFGILYTPEVFANIKDGGKLMGGVQPNSLAAISELLNGYYWHGSDQGIVVGGTNDIGYKQPKVLANAAVIASLPRTGPAYPFLVGTRNAANISFNSDKKVFETIGGALLAWCVDEVVQDELLAFTMTNWQSRSSDNLSDSDLLINKGAREEVAMPAFNAIGCARVSVGTRFLERYSSQRLAYDAASFITRFHMESEDAKQVVREFSTNLPAEISRHLAGRYFTWFARECQLEEEGFEKNQILDAIRPEQTGTLDQAAESQAKSMVDIGKASADQWIEAVNSAVRQATSQYQTDYRPLLDAKVKQWVERIPKKVVEATEKAISLYGLAVTVDLLDELVRYLGKVESELMSETEHGAYTAYASESEWSGQVRAVLGTVRGNFTMQTNEKIGEAIGEGLRYSCCFAEAELREVVSPLIGAFVDGFLKPLKSSLGDAFVLLEREMNELTTWPSWTGAEASTPPAEVTPPDSEYTLIAPEQFSKVFLDTLARTVSNAEIELDHSEAHRDKVRADVISGSFLRQLASQTNALNDDLRPALAIQVKQTWSPGMQFVRDDNRPRNNVHLEVNFAPKDLEKRAKLWLRRPNTAFNDLLKSTLRTYTSNDGVFGANVNVSDLDYEDRRRQFISQLRRAVEASAPLVGLDNALQSNVHEERPLIRKFSQMPFGGHPLESAVVDLMRPHIGQGGGDDLIKQKYLSNDASVESVQIYSTLNGAHHPILFESLLDPIAKKWIQVKPNRTQVSEFWSMRRSRLLGESIPAPQEHIIAMIRGWFTGRILGLIDVAQDGENRATRIAQPWGLDSAPAPFPYPFLTPPAEGQPGDELAAVLEMLAIAFVEVSQANNLLPLRPYIVLRDMGSMMDGTNRLLAYDRPNPLISSWITSGNVSSRFSTDNNGLVVKDEEQLRRGLNSNILPDLAGVANADSSIRKATFLEILDSTIERYAADGSQYWNQASVRRSSLNNPPYWPALRTTSTDPDLIARALKSLRVGVNEVSTGKSAGI